MGHGKSYCKEGESESHVALGWAMLLSFVIVVILVLFGLAFS